jgi:nucleotide-binding universal stress UspA family protein
VLKTILVALDSSELSQGIIQTLEQLHIQTAAKIILSHVLPSSESDMEIEADFPHKSEELTYRHVEKQLQTYQEKLPCPSEIEIVIGDPAEEIIRLAHIYSCDLIVIGSRGLTGLKRILQGSVSSQVVADAPCSVLVVKPSETNE